MAYRRRQTARPSTFEVFPSSDDDGSSSPLSSLAAKAIRASSAGRASSLSSAYGEQAIGGGFNRSATVPSIKDSTIINRPSMVGNSEEATRSEGIWGALTRKARSILQDEDAADEAKDTGRHHLQNVTISSKVDHQPLRPPDRAPKRVGMLTSSLNYIGNALEEGLTKVEYRTGDIIQETKKLNVRKKNDGGSQLHVTAVSPVSPQQQTTDYETQLKASRNVANAMAAKAKLLLRELKTVKADLAFAKERCAQLEEENKVIRESRDKGNHHDDDDLVRMQLETLLAEKARLAHENSVYARENRFLREIVEYHQLTMQDVVYLDEGIEEVTEVYPSVQVPSSSPLAPSPSSPSEPPSLPVPVPPPSVALSSD